MAIERRLGQGRRTRAPLRPKGAAELLPWVRMALATLPGVLLAIAFAVALRVFRFPAVPQFVALAGMAGLTGACLAGIVALRQPANMRRRFQLIYASVVALEIATLGGAFSADDAWQKTQPGI